MSERVSFKWVEIEGFRGFNDCQRVLLDASAVLIVGPNGTGKTSFFDAIQWLLLGSLQRLERWRVRKNDEHIVNRYRGSEPAIVEAELEIAGRGIRLRRQGRYDSGFLEWHSEEVSLHGEDAERRLEEALTARPGQDIRRLLMTSALLQQDVVREVLEDKPAQRYEQLPALLGLDELGAFDTAVRSRAERLAAAGKAARRDLETAEDEAQRLRAQIETLEQSVRLADDVRQAREGIASHVEALAPTVVVSPLPATSADAALLQQLPARWERCSANSFEAPRPWQRVGRPLSAPRKIKCGALRTQSRQRSAAPLRPGACRTLPKPSSSGPPSEAPSSRPWPSGPWTCLVLSVQYVVRTSSSTMSETGSTNASIANQTATWRRRLRQLRLRARSGLMRAGNSNRPVTSSLHCWRLESRQSSYRMTSNSGKRDAPRSKCPKAPRCSSQTCARRPGRRPGRR